jgi:tellurite methyltransferase
MDRGQERSGVADEDRERWNRKYREADAGKREPSAALVELAQWLPERGRALDVAGGSGANAVWLARQGLEVTIVDVSEVGLGLAEAHARRSGVTLAIERADLEAEPLPAGPWALVLCCFYLQRELVPRIVDGLEPGGRLVWIHPTVTNLERHASPGPRFLLQPGEAARAVEAAGLQVRWAEEAWVGTGEAARHLARVVAERRAVD